MMIMIMKWADGCRTFREPRTPSYFTALTMGNNSFNPAIYGQQTNAIPYPHGANVQLTVYNWDDGFHPFHFHGYVPSLSSSLLPNNPPVIIHHTTYRVGGAMLME